MLVTIFTPTYNRAHTLSRLYHSLCKQTNLEFEWLIVDDGSTDNTEALVEKFINEKHITIRYYKQKNGGKHTAINTGINYAFGEVFAIVDSDDWLIDQAVEKIYKGFATIEKLNGFAGISYNKGYTETEAVGTSFDQEYLDARSNEREQYNIYGDKFEVFYTEVLKKFPFPVFEGERFISETVVWTRIAHEGLKIRWFNDIVYICEYLEDGLTNAQEQLNAKNPKGYALRIKEQVAYGNISFKAKLGYYSNYYKIRHNHTSLKNLAKEINANSMLVLLATILRYGQTIIKGKGN